MTQQQAQRIIKYLHKHEWGDQHQYHCAGTHDGGLKLFNSIANSMFINNSMKQITSHANSLPLILYAIMGMTSFMLTLKWDHDTQSNGFNTNRASTNIGFIYFPPVSLQAVAVLIVMVSRIKFSKTKFAKEVTNSVSCILRSSGNQ